MFMQHVQDVLLFLALAVNSDRFGVTCSYSSHLFLCALVHIHRQISNGRSQPLLQSNCTTKRQQYSQPFTLMETISSLCKEQCNIDLPAVQLIAVLHADLPVAFRGEYVSVLFQYRVCTFSLVIVSFWIQKQFWFCLVIVSRFYIIFSYSFNY